MRHLALVLALLLTACGTGRYVHGFDVEKFRSLEPGKATKADVLALAGPPIARSTMPDGVEVWSYYHSEARSTTVILPFYAHVESSGPQVKVAVLTFRGDVLERVEYKP